MGGAPAAGLLAGVGGPRPRSALLSAGRGPLAAVGHLPLDRHGLLSRHARDLRGGARSRPPAGARGFSDFGGGGEPVPGPLLRHPLPLPAVPARLSSLPETAFRTLTGTCSALPSGL